MNANFLKTSLAVALAIACNLAGAEVNEKVEVGYYRIRMNDLEQIQSDSLQKAIDQSTPLSSIRQWHTHSDTNWSVNWQIDMSDQDATSCVIKKVNVALKATVLLPNMATRNAQLKRQLELYNQQLLAHEQGHVEIARKTAGQIDAAIKQLPAMPNCEAMQERVNQTGQMFVQKGKSEESSYDRQGQK